MFGGWRKKVDHIKMIVLSMGDLVMEMPPDVRIRFDVMRRMFHEGREPTEAEMALTEHGKSNNPDQLWEPVDLYGWHIQATMYLLDGKAWWMVGATRKPDDLPSEKDMAWLQKIVDRLGGDLKRDLLADVIAHSGIADAHIWVTWINQAQLFEVQINPNFKDKRSIRIVPLGMAESNGYRRIDRTNPKYGPVRD